MGRGWETATVPVVDLVQLLVRGSGAWLICRLCVLFKGLHTAL